MPQGADQPQEPGGTEARGGVDPALVRMLDALRGGGDAGVFRGVGPRVDEADGSDSADEAGGSDSTDGADVTAQPLAQPERGLRQVPAAGRFDLSDLLPRLGVPRAPARIDVSSWGPDLWAALERLRRSEPPNWPAPAAETDLDAAQTVLSDGVALVGVPPSEVVVALLAAVGQAQRRAVLLAHEPAALEGCRRALSQVGTPALAEARWLAGRALDAHADGHHEAATALAGQVTTDALRTALTDPWAQLRHQVLLDPDLAAYTGLPLRAALLPALPLLGSATGTPTAAAAAGRADVVVALMATCSVLGGLAAMEELVALSRR